MAIYILRSKSVISGCHLCSAEHNGDGADYAPTAQVCIRNSLRARLLLSAAPAIAVRGCAMEWRSMSVFAWHERRRAEAVSVGSV
jgi:hypothetical protein